VSLTFFEAKRALQLALIVLIPRVSVAQAALDPLIFVKHVEPPLHYPRLARITQIQGVAIIRIFIGSDGTVTKTKPLTREEDPQATGHPLLIEEAEKLVKKWTFGCANCEPGKPYEHTIKFTWLLKGDGILYDDTVVSMDLPNEVTITASPVQCDHCPLPKKKSK
jgi:hypothetical protein